MFYNIHSNLLVYSFSNLEEKSLKASDTSNPCNYKSLQFWCEGIQQWKEDFDAKNYGSMRDIFILIDHINPMEIAIQWITYNNDLHSCSAHSYALCDRINNRQFVWYRVTLLLKPNRRGEAETEWKSIATTLIQC